MPRLSSPLLALQKKEVSSGSPSPIIKGNLDDESLLASARKSYTDFISETFKHLYDDAYASKYNGYPDLSTTVVGIEGAWGSGKSVFLKLLEEKIRDEEGFLYLEFSAWEFKDTHSQSQSFLHWLSSELHSSSSCLFKIWSLIITPITRSLGFIRHLLIPSLCIVALYTFYQTQFMTEAVEPNKGLWAILLVWMLAEMLRGFFTNLPEKIQSYSQHLDLKAEARIKKDVIKKLEKFKKYRRIFIAIEDIDRLDREELLSVFKIVKSVANFPRITYLIPFDRLHVHKNLRSDGTLGKHKFAVGFIQKAVHTSFRIPEASEHILRKSLVERFMSYTLGKGIYTPSQFEVDYFKQVTRKLAFTHVKTYRDVERVHNRAVNLANHMGRESNPADVLFVSFLQEFEPDLWRFISDSRRAENSSSPSIFEFCSKYIPSGSNPENITSFFNRLKSTILSGAPESLIEILVYYVFAEANEDMSNFRLGDKRFFNNYAKLDKAPLVKVPELAEAFHLAIYDEERKQIVNQVMSLKSDFQDRDGDIELEFLNELRGQNYLASDLEFDVLRYASLAPLFDRSLFAIEYAMYVGNHLSINEEKRLYELDELIKHLINHSNLIFIPLYLTVLVGKSWDFINTKKYFSTFRHGNEFEHAFNNAQQVWSRLKSIVLDYTEQWVHTNNQYQSAIFTHPHVEHILGLLELLDQKVYRDFMRTTIVYATGEVFLNACIALSEISPDKFGQNDFLYIPKSRITGIGATLDELFARFHYHEKDSFVKSNYGDKLDKVHRILMNTKTAQLMP